MDKAKTGALIAAARKEKNLTQRELAAALHVSDRAISKWERGAGFPDISLLEPLADTLDLGVLDLLRGERGTEPEPEPTVRQALAFLARQAKERTRKRVESGAGRSGAFGANRLHSIWNFGNCRSL